MHSFTKQCAHSIVDELEAPEVKLRLKTNVVDPLLYYAFEKMIPYTLTVFCLLLLNLLVLLGALVIMYRYIS